MNDIYSFYQLISKYQIEIPIIQRDYAQGRDNTKATDVRRSLVAKMIEAVENEENSLFFDFVYGRVDGNKFIPFDGQQRLTTLFLFHKYVFEKCQKDSDCSHKANCICKGILGRFSYATRQSSREFCAELVSNNIIPSDNYRTRIEDDYKNKLGENNKEKAKKYIESIDNWIYRFVTNQPWFYPDWQKDSTVMGMLTMLDEIHNQMKMIENFKSIAERLTSGCNCPITFHFVDMGEHKLSDETYVKMNARGKLLTPFENFKASLEQYLEDKKEEDTEKKDINVDLLDKLKGHYDSNLEKYTGIDGIWLDLFWDVANKGNNDKDKNEKELPDLFMMSFFNRHFMNVWRCWYEINKKSGNAYKLSDEEKKKQDKWNDFNDRIQKEMPLYPTKDDFVPFEIYSSVMKYCSAHTCLKPIFNIFDALYKNRDKIEKDCQAVWNRDKDNPKWCLYKGVKNKKDNRETYPSRIAFYALMLYFETKEQNDLEKDNSLSQWMRVVWNIIENSTIDSSDTYHAALRLINELSKGSHSIYDFLQNKANVITSKHAQDQVKEEINKAKQILDETGKPREYNGCHKNEDGSDYSTWEEIIIDAEKSAFFNGAIRFLFQNNEGEVNWNDFDTKWENAKKYFDENGVKDCEDEKYRTDAILLKSVLYHVKDFWKYIEPQKFVLDNTASTWKKNILLENGWENAVHEVLMGNLSIKERDNDCLMYKDLYTTDLLNYVANEQVGSRIRWIHGHRAIYPPHYEGIYLDDENRENPFYRNKILSILSDRISSEQALNCNFFHGWNINFKYSKDGNSYFFQWNTDDNVYLIENNERKKKADGLDYCFSTNNILDSDSFIEIINRLIQEISNNKDNLKS